MGWTLELFYFVLFSVGFLPFHLDFFHLDFLYLYLCFFFFLPAFYFPANKGRGDSH